VEVKQVEGLVVEIPQFEGSPPNVSGKTNDQVEQHVLQTVPNHSPGSPPNMAVSPPNMTVSPPVDAHTYLVHQTVPRHDQEIQ